MTDRRPPSDPELSVPDLRKHLASIVRQAITTLGIEGLSDLADMTIGLEQPADASHGDWSSNVAMANARHARMAPRDLAGQIAAVIAEINDPQITSVEVAGPGFLNFRLSSQWLHQAIHYALESGEEGFGRIDDGAGQKVLVEWVSANPTGPLHAGHARNAFFGDALARLLSRAGYEVGREFYLNDRGVQLSRLGESISAVRNGEPTPENGYAGDYIAEWAAEMPADADPAEYGYERSLQWQKETLANVGIEFDTWFSERSLVSNGFMDAAVRRLGEAGATYTADDALWLRTTDKGDDKDRVLIKSDGEPTYLLPDIAYHADKFERGWDRLIDVWGADHHGYIVRMKAAMAALGYSPDALEIEMVQLVQLLRDGEEVKISKRAGNILEFDELLDEVGPDVARLTYLTQSIETPQSIDLAKVVEQSMENPVYYIQMAHARLTSLIAQAADQGVEIPTAGDVDLALLAHQREKALMKALFDFDDVVSLAARERVPHRVTGWLRDLAAAVHGWYHDCPVLADSVEGEVRRARLVMAQAARVGLRAGLSTIGANAPDRL